MIPEAFKNLGRNVDKHLWLIFPWQNEKHEEKDYMQESLDSS